MKRAVSYFKQALAIYPEDLDSLNNLGNLYLKSDSTAGEGVALLEKCLAINSNFINAYYNLGNYYFTKNDWQEALANFNQIIRRDPVNIKALNALAGVYLETGQKRKAEFYYLEALNQDSGYPLTLYNLINLYEDSGQPDKARPLARRLSQLSGLPKKYGWLNNWAQDKLLKLEP